MARVRPVVDTAAAPGARPDHLGGAGARPWSRDRLTPSASLTTATRSNDRVALMAPKDVGHAGELAHRMLGPIRADGQVTPGANVVGHSSRMMSFSPRRVVNTATEP